MNPTRFFRYFILVGSFFLAQVAFAGSHIVTATANVQSIVDGGWTGQYISDYVSVGDEISATFVLDDSTSSSHLETEYFNPSDYSIEYRNRWSSLIESYEVSLTPSGAASPSVEGTASSGSLTRTRMEVYWDESPGPEPDEESDYLQLRATTVTYDLDGISVPYSSYAFLGEEHLTQGLTLCSDFEFFCLFDGLAGSGQALNWDEQRLGFDVPRYGYVAGAITSLSIQTVPEPGAYTAALFALSLVAFRAHRKRDLSS